MNTLKIHPTSIDTRVLSRAVDAMRDDGLVIYPTDTLYAIGCDATSRKATEALCRIKGINPQKNALAVVCHDFSQASEFARIDNRAFAIMRRYLPGPFTFILPSSPSMPKIFKGRKQVGIRIPDNDVARELARSLGTPLLTTSLPSDGLEPEEITEPGEIELRAEAMGVDMLIDAGSGSAIPSAVIDLTDSSAPVVLREGPVEFEF
ncbi:MAG TPA: threonylcarbamoyl-AMP synthase [Porphyromonadaceae bacterium]|jgi:tRNA threonylcarbamoyl adenosine modification protein (Sua5/YciO/YrdC/YwlC family)|nr:L-threonylcarbamoyladenylate synthase [Paramuribaculum sp.]HAB41567.1 threonylcarbamoyl-AMP synthase [Porphyromonadaceae bacterium]